jgi:hypothetical protein
VPKIYFEDNWANQLVERKFCTGGYDHRIWAREAEESSLLEVVVRERLVKKQRAVRSLAGAVVICELLSLAVAL